MSGSEFNRQAEHLHNIVKGYKSVNNGGKERTAHMKAAIENDFAKYILNHLDSSQRRRKEEIKEALDEFIDKWLRKEDVTATWEHLSALLFPPE